MDEVDCLQKQGVSFSSPFPHRAVQRTAAGFACYESPPGCPGRYFHRGIADQDGAFEWLNGRMPAKMMLVRGVTVPLQ